MLLTPRRSPVSALILRSCANFTLLLRKRWCSMKKWQQQQTRTELCELTDWRQTAFQAWNLSHACIHYKASSTVRTALVCSALRSGGGGAALAGAAENLRDLTTILLCLCVVYAIRTTTSSYVVSLGWIEKTRPKWDSKIREIDCINLTNFEYEARPMIGKGNRVNLLQFGWKNSWNQIKGTYFGRVVAI